MSSQSGSKGRALKASRFLRRSLPGKLHVAAQLTWALSPGKSPPGAVSFMFI